MTMHIKRKIIKKLIMILFFSEYCQHCNVLLDTIKKLDKNNVIKLVSIDTLRSLKKPINNKIHSVPALYLLDTKKILFGKEVFDYLILQNKFAFSGQNTRDNKKMKDLPDANTVLQQSQATSGEPQAFVLGAISSENFSSIDNTSSSVTDKNYKWNFITNEQSSVTTTTDITIQPIVSNQQSEIPKESTKDESKKLPTMEEIMQRRANEIL